jgi:hypothetical protein
MEYVSGIKIRDIFLDNGNWWKFFLKNYHLIRISIITNVVKFLACRTILLGFHFYFCPNCSYTRKVPHSCKSKLCSSCGKKATDIWIKTKFNTLPDTKWQHITFTMDEQLWPLFWQNRYLMNQIPKLAADIIKKLAAKEDFLPGIFLAIHTSGRDLKRNIHLHLSTTVGGLCISNNYTSWISNAYFHHSPIKKMWKYEIISFLFNEFKAGRLKLPANLKHIKSDQSFYSWLQLSYNKSWVVHLQKQSSNKNQNINYLGKYIKRPPISETRIKHYDGSTVTYKFLDHYTNSYASMSLPVLDFIARLVSHIPDKNFRNIRYYGFLSNRLSSKLLPLVYKFLNMHNIISKAYITWRDMIKKTFGYDPLSCPACKTLLKSSFAVFYKHNILLKHKEVAHGHFPLLQTTQ